eukprot:GHVR01144539.1.p1 GENE.GHVR01144539.1~~GHVR01144539.1.p1  ORF type:complete len:228 (+),score=5.12 GHVR01144539.1:191-874(+)
MQQSWTDLIVGLQPYAATSIQFNRNLKTINCSEANVTRNVEWIKNQAKSFALALDQDHFNTKHVENRVAKNDRFEAICIVEKAGVNPHLHMAWFQRGKKCSLSATMGTLERKCVLLETFNSTRMPLEQRDESLLKALASKRAAASPRTIVNWKAKGWSAVTKCIYSDGWAKYITKEQDGQNDFSNRMFLLSDFHHPTQRTKPTRFYTINEHTNAWLLNLDEPLVPRK